MNEGLSLPDIHVDEKELTALEQSASIVMELAQRVASSITDLTSCAGAQKWCAERLTFAANLRKKSWLSGIRDTWYKQHKSVCDIIERYAAPHEIAVRKVVNPAITIYLQAQEEQRLADERRLQEEARKRDEDARLARAAELAKQGKLEQADKILERPGNFIAPKIEPVKIEGMSQRKVWKVDPIEGENLIALVKAIAGGAVPIQAIEVNYSFLNKQAQLMDGNLNYAGVTAHPECVVSHRRIA